MKKKKKEAKRLEKAIKKCSRMRLDASQTALAILELYVEYGILDPSVVIAYKRLARQERMGIPSGLPSLEK